MTTAPVLDPPVAPRTQVRTFDAVALLTIYLVLLMAIPARLIISTLGGAGAPATVFGVVIFVWWLVIWLNPALTPNRRAHPIRLAGAGFACAIITSYISANRHAMPTLELNAADRGLISLAGWLGVLLLAGDCIDKLDRLKTLFRRIVIGATAMAVLGITQFFTGLDAAKYIIVPGLSSTQPYSDLLSRGDLRRPSATALHPIEFGTVLAISLPLAIHQARFAPPELRRRRWLQVTAIAATLPMTVSRSAILGLLVSAVVILPTWPKRDRRIAYLIGGVSSIAMWAVIPGLFGTLRDLFLQIGSQSDSSTQSRTSAFSAAGPFIAQHPWFGRGFGTFLPQTYFFLDEQYLGSLIETGIIGLLALVALFVTGWITARSVRRHTSDPELRHLAQCLAASVLAAAVAFATFDALSYGMSANLTFLLLGCIGALWRLVRVERKAEPDCSPGERQSLSSLHDTL